MTGTGPRFTFDYKGADAALAINRLLKEGAKVAFERTAAAQSVVVTGATRKRMESLAAELGLAVTADAPKNAAAGPAALSIKAPRVGLYQSWTASMDEGWTRWVLEQWEFAPKTLHNADVKAGKLRQQFDVIVLADQQPRDILNGNESSATRPEYRGGIGEEGLQALKAFVADGGTLVMLGNSTELAIQKWPIPVRNLKPGFTRDQHFAPGTIVRVQVDTASALGFGLPAGDVRLLQQQPVLRPRRRLRVAEGVGRRPLPEHRHRRRRAGSRGRNSWRDAPPSCRWTWDPGRLVLFGLRPQHRAQTHATFPLLFNALYSWRR